MSVALRQGMRTTSMPRWAALVLAAVLYPGHAFAQGTPPPGGPGAPGGPGGPGGPGAPGGPGDGQGTGGPPPGGAADCSATSTSGEVSQLDACRRDRAEKRTTQTVLHASPPIDRWVYRMCENGKSCSRYDCDGNVNEGCVWTRVHDRQFEAMNSCFANNRRVREQLETCKSDLGALRLSNGAELKAGRMHAIYKTGPVAQDLGGGLPSPGASDPCSNAPELLGVFDIGEGEWDERELSIPTGPSDPIDEDYQRNSNDYRTASAQTMILKVWTLLNSKTFKWPERYSIPNFWNVVVRTTPHLRSQGDAVKYANLPPVQGAVCYNTAASLFVQGWMTAPGTAQTASPSNIDVTTSGARSNPSNPRTIADALQLLLRNTLDAYNLLGSNKPQADCDAQATVWNKTCRNLPEGTYAHSMGAIATRVWGLPTTFNVASVDNVAEITSRSAANNCDFVPSLVQHALRLMERFPTTDDVVNYSCSVPGRPDRTSDCVKDGVWLSMNDPRSVGCYGSTTSPTCQRKWCAGRPQLPTTHFLSGRGGLGKELTVSSPDLTSICRRRNTYLANLKPCLDAAITGGIPGWASCAAGVLNNIWALNDELSDHYFRGKDGNIDFNGYQVLPGLDNLGPGKGQFANAIDRRRRSPTYGGTFIQNPPPPPPKPGELHAQCISLP